MGGGLPGPDDELDGVAWSPAPRDRVVRSALLLALAVGATGAVAVGWAWLAAVYGGGVPWLALVVGTWIPTAFVAVSTHRLLSDLRPEPPTLLRVVAVVYVAILVVLAVLLTAASRA
jgi:hypothetical protein